MAYYPRFIGGAEVAIKELTDRLGSEYEFHMVTLRYDTDLPRVSLEGNVLVHRIGFGVKAPSLSDLKKLPLHLNKYLFQLTAYLRALSLQRKYHYDAVWSMMAHSAGIPSALFKMTHPKIPLLLSLQEGDTPERIAQVARPSLFLFRLVFTYADRIQVISKFLASWARTNKATHDAVVIPNGVDVARFSAAQPISERAQMRKQWNVADTDILLITASRLVKKNGVDIVLESLTHVPKEVKFLIAGDGPERAQLEAQVEKNDLSSRVIFEGEVSQEMLPSYLHAADMFIRASRSEGLGIAFIEALAAGLPTIGVNVGGIPDLLVDGDTGFLASKSECKEVSDAILRAVSNPVTTKEIASRGQIFSQTFDWSTLALRMKEEAFEPLWK